MLARLLLKTLDSLRQGHLTLRLPNGTQHEFGDAESDVRAVVHVRRERFFSRVLLGGDVGTGDAYVDGDWDSPDLVQVVRLAVRNRQALLAAAGPLAWVGEGLDGLRHWRNRNTVDGSRRNIAAHYDLSNDFFSLFLDRSMVYSCATYPTAQSSLEQAQTEKLDRMCRKLALQPEDHLLEIGTGWGAFAIHAAKHYGCRVTTTTISRQQHDYAAARIAESGVKDQITLLQQDYRNLRGSFDKIASIEMFEAVGLQNYDAFFQSCDALLKPDGVMALQTITMNEHHFSAYRRGSDWIQQRIFPGGELASVRAIQDSLVRATALQMHDMEDIGMHYAETLAEWNRRFQKNRAKVTALGFDEAFQRAWTYYLAYCEGAFRERFIGDVQIVFAKRGTARALPGEPWARPSKHAEAFA